VLLPEPLSTLEGSPIQRRFAGWIVPKSGAKLEALEAESPPGVQDGHRGLFLEKKPVSVLVRG
jgi:hypothetical protein